MPFLILVYLFAYIDRANLSVAKLQMQGDLGFNDAIIGFGAGIFFIGYFLLEVPGTLIVERWSARRWLAGITVVWGMIATITGFLGVSFLSGGSHTHRFYVLRFLLGAAESGFFPRCNRLSLSLVSHGPNVPAQKHILWSPSRSRL